MATKKESESDNQIFKVRHSLSHLLATAVLEKWPNTKLAIGPVIENGFYYDFDFAKPISENDIKDLEEKMGELVKQNLTFKKKIVTYAQAKKLFTSAPYKLELIEELHKKKSPLSIYETSYPKKLAEHLNKSELAFVDLCSGPHIKNTEEITPRSFKLMSLAGAYWRGSEKNKMLTRIYGVAFQSKEKLQEYVQMLAEAEKRDHKKLGKELGLYVFSELVGPGLPLYTFNGAIIRREIVKFSNELQESIGYREVHTPNMNKAELFKVSGHYDKYKDSMFKVVSNYSKEEYFLKPMNCPQHTQIYASEKRSYKDLPVRIADFANLYRDEKPGELSGLTRLRAFSQDDGHSFCREDQIKEEFLSVLNIIKVALKTYGMNYSIRLSLWDPKHREKYLGEPKAWNKSQKILEDILKENKIEYSIGIGEAAIYGPKMDIITKDSLGREWQISTIQLDLIMPKRFGLTYTDKEGKQITPVMIHRAIVGSPERFMGILIEHYAGAFPTWLSPVQTVIIPVSEKHADYSNKIRKQLKEAGIRAEVSEANETLGKRIRGAELQKTPYILIVGDKEIQNNSVNVRSRHKEQLDEIDINEFTKNIVTEIKNRT
jgi:threonyl-tRNA synthetase